MLRYFDDDSFEVAVGPMKMKVARDDFASVVARADSNPVASARSRGINVSLAREDESVPTEINVIGQTVDEATQAVEKFVDRAFLAGAIRLRVVHGSGMGILRKALRQYLQDSSPRRQRQRASAERRRRRRDGSRAENVGAPLFANRSSLFAFRQIPFASALAKSEQRMANSDPAVLATPRTPL